MINNYVFSSESVGEGHPDKVADYISDSILDACLEQDKFSRVACETLVKSNCVVIAGEITTKAVLDYEKIVRNAVREIGYVNSDDVFHADQIFLTNLLTRQSPDIAQGVDARKAKGKKTAEQGAGDQGIMFGYATNETPEMMPAPIMFAHRILTELARQRKGGRGPKWLRPDCKSQVAVAYEDGKPAYIENVVVSTQHAAGVSHAEIEKYIVEKVVKKVLPKKLITKKTQFLVNPTGNFVVGGPQGDSGLTGRKIIVDSYGGAGRHGGGAFSGKDPSKVDRSAAYMCSPTGAKSRSPTPSAIRSRSASRLRLSERRKFRRRKSKRRYGKFSASSRPTSSRSSTSCALSTRRRPITGTSPSPTCRGKRPTRPENSKRPRNPSEAKWLKKTKTISKLPTYPLPRGEGRSSTSPKRKCPG